MKILVIGGSRFVGYYLVEAALRNGHEVTTFNRGKSNPGAFANVEEIHGDRDGGLDVLKGRSWDVVVDTCGYVPRVVRASAEALKDAVKQYIFISTVSVYSDFPPEGIDEDSKLATLEDETTEQITGETYGALKVLCENVVQEVYPAGALIIRPGLIVGPRDSTHRFGYWVKRVAEGGEVLAPGKPERVIQYIDVRDLGDFTLHMAETQKTGIYNAVGPEKPVPMGDFLNTCVEVAGSNATFTWVEEEFLTQNEVTPWMNLPMWLPEKDNGIHLTSNQRAVANGLTYRSTQQIVRDTLDWLNEQPASGNSNPYGAISHEREQELLQAWHKRSS